MRLGPCVISTESYRATSSIAPLSFTISECGSHYGNMPNLSILMYCCAYFCESVIIPALKPIQYIDIYKRYLTSSEFSLCLSLWSCWMIGKNSGQAFLIIMKMKFLLTRRKLTNRQNQMDTHTLIFYLTLFSIRNSHLIWPSQVFLLVPGFKLLP